MPGAAIDRVGLEMLDSFLMFDRSPPDGMMLSDLDGFLTRIAVGPELVLPSEGLALIRGGAEPEFAEIVPAKCAAGSANGS